MDSMPTTVPGRKKREMRHFFRYQLIRLHRLAEDSHAIALGVAWGIFVSFTPFLGFHLILCTLMCILFGGSKLASWIGSLIGNPATFPFFFWADHRLGSWIMGLFGLGGGGTVKFSWDSLTFDALFSDMTHIIVPILFGAVILAPLAAACGYWATYKFVELTRHRRLARMKLARQRYGESGRQV
ncbi:MAG: DUF2062 domain-containing protein [Magnetococcales bacterium]|nr:DUF2062 domain-containing protein [Magnetococcales bacterium]